MYHQAISHARRELNDWIAQHLPVLADDATSPEADGMVLALSRLARLMKIQISAMDEQWSQDEWARRDQDADAPM